MSVTRHQRSYLEKPCLWPWFLGIIGRGIHHFIFHTGRHYRASVQWVSIDAKDTHCKYIVLQNPNLDFPLLQRSEKSTTFVLFRQCTLWLTGFWKKLLLYTMSPSILISHMGHWYQYGPSFKWTGFQSTLSQDLGYNAERFNNPY